MKFFIQGLIIFFLSACSLFQARNKTEMQSLMFYFSSYEAGEPIIIIGAGYNDDHYDLIYYPIVQVKSSSGDRIDLQMLRWKDLTASQIDRSLDHSNRSAIILFKEAYEEYSYDYENREWRTSDKTKFEAIAHIRSLEGIEIDRVLPYGPSVLVTIDAREVELIQKIQNHPYTDQIHANLPLIPLSELTISSSKTSSKMEFNDYTATVSLVSVIATDGSMQPNINVQPGDSVEVSYVQPDGSVFRHKTFIRDSSVESASDM